MKSISVPTKMLLSLVLLSCLGGISAQQSVRGRIFAPGAHVDNLASAVVSLRSSSGREVQTFPEADGSFTFPAVSPGSHVISVFQLGLVFPEVRVEISKKHGVIRASYVDNKLPVMHNPLVIRPLGEAQYLENRKPINIRSFIFSMPGMMLGMGLLVFFVLPKLKVDPEEYQEFARSNPTLTGAAAALAAGPNAGGASQPKLRDK